MEKDLIFITEGVFDGQHMVDKTGKIYLVPENYASKSKLVVGDKLKLYQNKEGRKFYKQVHQIDRVCAVGKAIQINHYTFIEHGNTTYKILTASVMFYKISPGDAVNIALPKNKKTTWATVIDKL